VLGRDDIGPSEAASSLVECTFLETIDLKRQPRVPSSLSSPRPQLINHDHSSSTTTTAHQPWQLRYINHTSMIDEFFKVVLL